MRTWNLSRNIFCSLKITSGGRKTKQDYVKQCIIYIAVMLDIVCWIGQYLWHFRRWLFSIVRSLVVIILIDLSLDPTCLGLRGLCVLLWQLHWHKNKQEKWITEKAASHLKAGGNVMYITHISDNVRCDLPNHPLSRKFQESAYTLFLVTMLLLYICFVSLQARRITTLSDGWSEPVYRTRHASA
jgi:hypothetical protein